MRKNPVALAWTVLLAAFLILVVIVVSVPLSVRWYVDGATSERAAEIEVIAGTALLQRPGDKAETGLLTRQGLREGDSIRTTGDGQAVIWLFDGSSVRLWQNSRFLIRTTRSSQFSNALTTISLTLAEGHCRAEVAIPSTQSRRFEIITPSSTILLREGSYSIEVINGLTDSRTELTTRIGSATISGAGKTLELQRAERAVVSRGEAPAGPLVGARNLVANGDFSQELTHGWTLDRRSEDRVDGAVERTSDDGRDVARFTRTGSSKHGEALLVQTLNRDVTDYDILTLGFQAKVREQSLSGGGWLGSEYPLMARLTYRDVNGNEVQMVRGFYVQNRDSNPTTNGQLIPADTWYSPSPPLDLFDPRVTPWRPAYLVRLELAASGWAFDSSIADVRLMAE